MPCVYHMLTRLLLTATQATRAEGVVPRQAIDGATARPAPSPSKIHMRELPSEKPFAKGSYAQAMDTATEFTSPGAPLNATSGATPLPTISQLREKLTVACTLVTPTCKHLGKLRLGIPHALSFNHSALFVLQTRQQDRYYHHFHSLQASQSSLSSHARLGVEKSLAPTTIASSCRGQQVSDHPARSLTLNAPG
eukprot:4997454-Pleurochrysis_carterae.AAC.1